MIVTIVGWLVLFVFLPNLMIIGTSFLARDDASFVKMVFTLDNYTRLLADRHDYGGAADSVYHEFHQCRA
ncbi:putative spermidine/putrescine transport system permease, partial [Escherichia coli 97.1742]